MPGGLIELSYFRSCMQKILFITFLSGLCTACSVITATRTDGREVIMNHKRLTEVPIELYYDTTITKLSLFGNKITDIDAELANLQ